MELATVQYLREKHKKNSNFLLVTADNILYFFNNKDFLIWDDDNKVLHCVRANTAGAPEYVNGQSPVIIKSLSYNEIFFISSGYDCKTFNDTVIDEFFGDLMTDKQKTILREYVNNISHLQDIEYNDAKYSRKAGDGTNIKEQENTVMPGVLKDGPAGDPLELDDNSQEDNSSTEPQDIQPITEEPTPENPVDEPQDNEPTVEPTPEEISQEDNPNSEPQDEEPTPED